MSGLDIQLEKSENDSPVTVVCKDRLQVAKYDKSYTVFFRQLIRTNGLVVKVSSSE